MTTKELLQKFIDDAKEDGVISVSAYNLLNGRVEFYTEVVFDENAKVNGDETSHRQALNLADVNVLFNVQLQNDIAIRDVEVGITYNDIKYLAGIKAQTMHPEFYWHKINVNAR